MKRLSLVLLCSLVTACSSIKSKSDRMSPGTSRDEITQTLGAPIRTKTEGTNEVLFYSDNDWNCEFSLSDSKLVDRACAVDTGPELSPEERAAKRARWKAGWKAIADQPSTGGSYGDYYLESQRAKPGKIKIRDRNSCMGAPPVADQGCSSACTDSGWTQICK